MTSAQIAEAEAHPLNCDPSTLGDQQLRDAYAGEITLANYEGFTIAMMKQNPARDEVVLQRHVDEMEVHEARARGIASALQARGLSVPVLEPCDPDAPWRMRARNVTVH
jgi:hypothetical protein